MLLRLDHKTIQFQFKRKSEAWKERTSGDFLPIWSILCNQQRSIPSVMQRSVMKDSMHGSCGHKRDFLLWSGSFVLSSYSHLNPLPCVGVCVIRIPLPMFTSTLYDSPVRIFTATGVPADDTGYLIDRAAFFVRGSNYLVLQIPTEGDVQYNTVPQGNLHGCKWTSTLNASHTTRVLFKSGIRAVRWAD